MMQCWGAVFLNLPIGAAFHVDSQMIELSKQKLFAVEIARRKQLNRRVVLAMRTGQLLSCVNTGRLSS